MGQYVTVKSLDGVDVEVTHSDAGRQPGLVGGQFLNTTAVWCRPAGGEWVRSPHRSAIKTADIIAHAQVKDFVDTFLKETGYEGTKAGGDGSGTSLVAKLQPLQGHSSGHVDKGSAGKTKV